MTVYVLLRGVMYGGVKICGVTTDIKKAQTWQNERFEAWDEYNTYESWELSD